MCEKLRTYWRKLLEVREYRYSANFAITEFCEVRLSQEPIRPSARPTKISTPEPRRAQRSTICLATSSRP